MNKYSSFIRSLTEGAPKAPHLEKFESSAASSTFKEPPQAARKVPLSERILADLALTPDDVAKSLGTRTVADVSFVNKHIC